MARSYSQCEVLQQDFLAMKLPESRFDGIFANASLFHVPSQELPRVLVELSETPERSSWRCRDRSKEKMSLLLPA